MRTFNVLSTPLSCKLYHNKKILFELGSDGAFHRAVLGVAAVALLAAGVAAFDRKRQPVYYGETEASGFIELEMTTVPYRSLPQDVQVGGFATNVAYDESHGEMNVIPEVVLLDYLSRVLASDYQGALPYYAPGQDSAAVVAGAEALHRRIRGLQRVEFLYSVLHEEHRLIFVRMTTSDGRTEAISFAFARAQGGFLLANSWQGEAGPLLGLLVDLAGQMNAGIASTEPPVRPRYEIELGQGITGMILRFDGEVFADTGEWLTAARAADVEAPGFYAESLLFRNAATTTQEFSERWCSGQLSDALLGGEEGPDALKDRYSADGGIKHVATLDFKDSFAHYYMEESDPWTVKTVFLRRDGEGYCQEWGPDRAGLRGFLKSDLIGHNLLLLWRGQS